MGMKAVDIKGKRFGRLVVIERAPEKNKHGQAMWICLCDCGQAVTARSNHLRTGGTHSCGCLKREVTSSLKPGKSHGLSYTQIYKRWASMLTRCYRPTAANYHYYGGRGITVCEEWRDSVEAFIRDMGLPEEGQSIDRIDVNGNYEPSNCRWATATEQARNKRNSRAKQI